MYSLRSETHIPLISDSVPVLFLMEHTSEGSQTTEDRAIDYWTRIKITKQDKRYWRECIQRRTARKSRYRLTPKRAKAIQRKRNSGKISVKSLLANWRDIHAEALGSGSCVTVYSFRGNTFISYFKRCPSIDNNDGPLHCISYGT